MKKDVIIASYVDGCLIFSKDKKKIRDAPYQLALSSFFIDEGSIEQCLGMQIDENNDGSITMHRPYLLKRIIEELPGLKDANPASMPSMSMVKLTKDAE